MVSLEDVHNCTKCRGKIVCISVDNVGVTRCGYCNAVVNYEPYYHNLYKDEVLQLVEELKLQNLEKEALKKWQKKKKKKRRKRKEKLTVTPSQLF